MRQLFNWFLFIEKLTKYAINYQRQHDGYYFLLIQLLRANSTSTILKCKAKRIEKLK
jgi:hypothetical protein